MNKHGNRAPPPVTLPEISVDITPDPQDHDPHEEGKRWAARYGFEYDERDPIPPASHGVPARMAWKEEQFAKLNMKEAKDPASDMSPVMRHFTLRDPNQSDEDALIALAGVLRAQILLDEEAKRKHAQEMAEALEQNRQAEYKKTVAEVLEKPVKQNSPKTVRARASPATTEKIISYFRNNPGCRNVDAAKACGVSQAMISLTRSAELAKIVERGEIPPAWLMRGKHAKTLVAAALREVEAQHAKKK